MRVLYLTDANLALRRGHTKNIVKTVEALGTADIPCAVGEQWGVVRLFQRRNEFDVLYLRDHHLLMRALFVKYILGKRIVYEVHSTHGLLWLRQLLFLVADGVVYITRKLQHAYDPHMKKKSVVVHTAGSEPEAFDGLPSSEELRGALHLPAPAFLIGDRGSVKWYNLSVLIRMMSLLSPDTALLLGGVKEEEATRFKEEAEKLGVAGRIILPGRIAWEDLPRYLAAADVLVNPLAAELPGSVSSKLYEYLAAGKPIVSTRGGANDEVMHDEENGLVVLLTPEAFADALERLRKDPSLAARIAACAQTDARRYTWQKRGEKIATFLKTI